MTKRLLTIVMCVALAASCTPESVTLLYNMRYPSKSGLDLAGKSISVAYLHTGSPTDTLFNRNFAEGMASVLESDYFDGETTIDFYSLPKDPAGQYASRDSMINLVLDIDSDVLFVIDAPVLMLDNQKVNYMSKVYVYDTMNKSNDKVYVTQIYTEAPSGDNLGSAASLSGIKVADSFLSQQKEEQYSIIYYDDFNLGWTDGLEQAAQCQWDQAITSWLPLMDCRNINKKACAAYNICLACYMMGELDLAEEWLDTSDAYGPISLSLGMRKRIASMRSYTK